MWLLAVPAAGLLVAIPVGQRMLARLASGFAAQDRAAALRLDEYRQALRIIADYPVLGVGFGGAPEVGTFVGVSSIYLLVGEHTGLVGLGLLLLTLAVIAVAGLRAALTAPDPDDPLPHWRGTRRSDLHQFVGFVPQHERHGFSYCREPEVVEDDIVGELYELRCDGCQVVIQGPGACRV